MPGSKEKFSPDKFPGMLESPGTYRKNSNDFGVTFAVPAEKVEHIQPLMQKAGKFFVAYLVQVSDAVQADLLLAQDLDEAVDGRALPEPKSLDGLPDTVPVGVLADLLDMTDRNIQILEQKGIVFKDNRGQYRLRESIKSVLKEERLRGDGKNSDFNRARTEAMQLKRQQAEVDYLERVGALVNAEEVRRAIEKAKANDRQKWIVLPKHLAPRLDGLTAQEIEPILEDYVRESLTQLSAFELPRNGGHGGVPDHGAPAETHRERMGGRKKKTQRKKRR